MDASSEESHSQGGRRRFCVPAIWPHFQYFHGLLYGWQLALSILVERIKVEVLGIAVMLVSSMAMMAIVFSTSDVVSFVCMNLFEMCVGMYWPIMGTMKGGIVPEDQRAAIYNLFRIP